MMNDQFTNPNRNWPKKFGAAFRAVALGVRTQISFAVHFTAALLVVIAGLLLRVTLVQWCLLVLCITVVLSAEMMNSALETLAKAIDRRYNPHLADGLDLASAAVLLAAIGAAVVGVTIFLQRALALFA